MAVLSNTMLQGTAADSGEDSYQISKGLRFNDADGASLKRTSGKGNTRKWTFSTWIKRTAILNQGPIFSGNHGSSNPYHEFYFTGSTDRLATWKDGAGEGNINVSTNRVFRDLGAWYHIVYVWDTGESTDSDRIRMYVNGVRETSFASTTWPAQNHQSAFNRDGAVNSIYYGLVTSSDHSDCYGAEPILIDGLALSPAAFGKFDSTGNWVPKTFALPTSNDGTTWSSAVSGSQYSGYADTGGFNGIVSV